MAKPKGPKPKKPRPDFPLFAHASGTWAKTIDGKHKHFGPWHDPAAAEREFDEFARARKAKRAPRPLPDGSITLRDLANRFLTFKHQQMTGREITLTHFANCKDSCEAFVRSVGPTLTVNDLSPEGFADYRAKLGQRYGAHGLNNNLGRVRLMFKWAYENDLIDRPVKFGSGFERMAHKGGKRPKLFTADEIRAMLDQARPGSPIRAMVLLGINAGFGNTDCSALELSDLDLDKGLVDLPRHKTGVHRRCTLWPETVKAIRAALKVRPKPLNDADKGLVFVTRFGWPFRRVRPVKQGDVVVGAQTMDAIHSVFRDVLADAGIRQRNAKGIPVSDGRDFYALRHTHRTWADEVLDHHAAALIMGHKRGDVASIYVQQVGDDRLKKITDHIHSKLFKRTRSPAKKSKRAGRGGA